MFRNVDLIVYGIVNNFVSKFNLEDYRLLFFALICITYGFIPEYYKSKAFDLLRKKFYKKPNSITFEVRSNNTMALNMEAISDYINRHADIRESKQILGNKNYILQASQRDDFVIDNELKIYCNIHSRNMEQKEYNISKIITVTNLQIYSYKISNKELRVWTEDITEKYKKKQENIIKETQKVFEVYYEVTNKYTACHYLDFESNITFETNYFIQGEEIIKKIDFFSKNKKFFKDRGIKRSLNFLFSGKPGTGKTGILKAIANYTKRNLIMIKLRRNFPANELETVLRGKISGVATFDFEEVIFVIEEIDLVSKIFNDRNTIDEDRKDNKNSEDIIDNAGSLGVILNAMDGIPEANGRMIIMTTNRPEKIDEAVKRAGRTEHYTFGNLNKYDIVESCKKFWDNEFQFGEEDIRDEIDNFYTSAELMQLNISADNDFDKIKGLLIK